MSEPTFPNVLTPNEIADLLHIDPKTVRKWLRERSLIGIQLPGGDWRVLQPDFDAFIHHHRLQPVAATIQ
ncbi:MAG: helix-turn-helix domain-containing protein [Oscillochloris sp.]|nr:helix-turn-helix domain-containing protein [Oscillochloris sp.]